MKIPKHFERSFTKQIEEQDCGVACLLSLIRYYGGDCNLQKLRDLSGTSLTGTTLLGLYQAANTMGFDADGCKSGIEELINHGRPVILHVQLENNQEHYIVYYGISENKNYRKLIIGDPAKGIYYLDPKDLAKIWISRACLILYPNDNFEKKENINSQKIKWIKYLIKEDISLLGIAAALGLSITALNMVMAVFSQKLIDDILPKRNFTELYLGIVLVFLLLLFKESFNYLRQYFLLNQSKTFNNRIIAHFYSNILHLPKPFFDTRKIGELTARLNDTSRIQRVIAQIAGNTIIDVFMVITAIIFLFIYSSKIAILSLFCLPIFYIIIKKFKSTIVKTQSNVMVSYAISESNYISTLQGIESIKNSNKQSLFSEKNRFLYGNYQNDILCLGKIQIKLGFIANGFALCFLISILILASLMVLQGSLKAGELMALLGISSTLLPSVSNLAMLSIPINEAKVAFDRMFEFSNTISEEKVSGNLEITFFESIEIKEVAFRFPGRKQLIHNISLSIQKGEIVALMGENGSGKSTISQIIQKHYQAEAGQITINCNTPLSEISLSSWRKLISVVPQNVHIFNGTVLENIAFDDAFINTQKVLLFINQIGFAPFIDCLPQSYSTLVGEEGINLSGGQKQIIAIARALYHKPQFLILDEATSAMDKQSEKHILNMLVQLKKEMGILFITHKLHILKSLCDKIYILENGVISTSGDHNDLLKSSNLYSSYWRDLVS